MMLFTNNNYEITRKLTRRSLQADKKRNFILITAIMLTTLLLSSTFSIGMSVVESMQMQRIRLTGSVAHATLSNPTDEQIERLKELDYVKYVGTGIGVGVVENTPKMGQIYINLCYIDDIQWKYMNMPAFSDINGQYPQESDEIMLSRFALERMGITEPQIGMTIDLSYWTDNYRDNHSMKTNTFTLSGWFTNYYYVSSGGWDYGMVADELAKQYSSSLEVRGSANIIFSNLRNINTHIERLNSDLILHDGQTIESSPAYKVDYSSFQSIFISLIVLSLLFVFTGILLIYNVLYISISRDIRFYGLLKTVGTTSRQIRRIVLGLVLRLCIIGIPIGGILSTLISFFIVPSVISANNIGTGTVISFSPVIYIGAVLLALLTALIGAIIPAKKAAQITPVEAVKYTEGNIKSRRNYSANGNLYRMAFRNIFRDRKRACVVFLSLSLGIAVFITVSSFLSSISVDKYADMEMKNDFYLENRASVVRIGTNVFSDELLQSIKEMNGLSKLQIFTETFCELDFTVDSGFEETLIKDGTNKQTGTVYGIDKSVIEDLNKTLSEPIDAEAFDRGDFALVATNMPDNYKNIKEVKGSFLTGVSMMGTTFEIPVNGCVSLATLTNNYLDTEFILLVSNSYLRQVADYPQIRHIVGDVIKGKDKEAFFVLNEMLKDDNNISLTSRYQIKQSLRDSIVMIYILGGGIAFVLGLIGIMNFVNIMSVSIMIRKRELAILNSIGMEEKKMRKMLVLEGLGYAAISLLLALIVGSGIAAGICIPLAREYEYVFYTYPIVPVIATCLIIVGISIITPEIIYRTMNKATVVERLREAE